MDRQADSQPDSQGDAREADTRFYTDDGVFITNGLRVWNNDLAPCAVWVAGSGTDTDTWDGWFQTITDTGAITLLNGERMVTRHPFTRADVPPPPVDPRRDELAALHAAGVPIVAVTDPAADPAAHRGTPMAYQPRVPDDPTPWACEFIRRQPTSAVHANPNTTDQLETYLRTLVPQLAALTLVRTTAGHVEIDMLRVAKTERGHRHGERAMSLLTAWADHNGVTLTATPEPAHLPGERRTGRDRLRRWHTRHGFRPNRGRRPQYSDSMFRDPTSPTTSQE